jgi:hypothetical protein
VLIEFLGTLVRWDPGESSVASSGGQNRSETPRAERLSSSSVRSRDAGPDQKAPAVSPLMPLPPPLNFPLPAPACDDRTGEELGLCGLCPLPQLGAVVRIVPPIAPAARDAADQVRLLRLLGGDPVCLHRAAYWYAQGVLELDPETPASATSVLCFRCRGAEAGCPVCQGTGVASLSTQAAALRAAA